VEAKKRVFIGLLAVVLIVLAGLSGTLWYLLAARPDAVSRTIVWVVVTALAVGVPVFGLGLIILVWSIISKKSPPALQRLVSITVDALYPFVLGVGRLVGISKDRIEMSFIEVNNLLVKIRSQRLTPDRVLVLLPHCLQRADCPHKITMSLDNCRRCGKCVIGEILALRDRYRVRLSVATGGTQARRTIEALRPAAIVAVACERELASGIQDVQSVPVLAVVNERPEGPCRNTTVNLMAVGETIEYFLKGGA